MFRTAIIILPTARVKQRLFFVCQCCRQTAT